MRPDQTPHPQSSDSVNSAYNREFIASLVDLFNLLPQESDRGAVLISAATMDDTLAELLGARLIPSPERHDELFEGPYAPLASLSAKIDFAYRLGLLTLKIRSSLHIIRKVRNDFAHSSILIDFESQSVRNRVQQLFRLNKELLDLIWETAEAKTDPRLRESLQGFRSEEGVDNLIKIMGWRSAFELLASLIAASLKGQCKEMEPLLPLGEVGREDT